LTARLQQLGTALNAAGFEAELSADIRHAVWTKLIGNLSYNPIAALTFARMDQIHANTGLLAIIRPMMAEAMQVASHYGVHIAMTPDERIALARQLGAAKISMHQDFEQHRRPEIEAIVGTVIELADRAGIAIPTIRMVEALLRERAVNDGLL
jgi:2-dehydropantoate 2-reductase